MPTGNKVNVVPVAPAAPAAPAAAAAVAALPALPAPPAPLNEPNLRVLFGNNNNEATSSWSAPSSWHRGPPSKAEAKTEDHEQGSSSRGIRCTIL